MSSKLKNLGIIGLKKGNFNAKRVDSLRSELEPKYCELHLVNFGKYSDNKVSILGI